MTIKTSMFWDNTGYSDESQPTFRRDTTLPTSESKNKPDKKPESNR